MASHEITTSQELDKRTSEEEVPYLKRVSRAILPVFLFTQEQYQKSCQESTNSLPDGNQEETKKILEKMNLGNFTLPLFFRLSYLTPLEGLANRVNRRLSWREKIVMDEVYNSSLSGKTTTHKELAKKIGISHQLVSRIKQEAFEKLRTILYDPVPTFTGKRPLWQILDEQIQFLIEEWTTAGSPKRPSLAPEEIWKMATFVENLIDQEDRFQEHPSQLLSSIPLSPPYDYLFSRQVLEKLVKEGRSKIYSKEEFKEKIKHLLRSFRHQVEEEMGQTNRTFRSPN